jgi:hypothetical protein
MAKWEATNCARHSVLGVIARESLSVGDGRFAGVPAEWRRLVESKPMSPTQRVCPNRKSETAIACRFVVDSL